MGLSVALLAGGVARVVAIGLTVLISAIGMAFLTAALSEWHEGMTLHARARRDELLDATTRS